jgi:FtsH-binding integral membrane protein
MTTHHICFIQKVYAILFTQIVFTTALTSLMTFHATIRGVCVLHTGWISLVCTIIAVWCLLALYDERWTTHIRLVLFGSFTFGISCIVGALSGVLYASSKSHVIVHALVTTMCIFVGLTCFVAMVSTNTSVPSLCIMQVLFASLLTCMVWTVLSPSHFLTGIFGITVFTGYIIVDTSRLVHDTHKRNRDQLLCAIELYLDVLNLFVSTMEFFVHDDVD